MKWKYILFLISILYDIFIVCEIVYNFLYINIVNVYHMLVWRLIWELDLKMLIMYMP